MKEKPKILIIEDDPDLVAAMKTMLENKGFTIATAYDPDEGMEKLKQTLPDLIILDVMFGFKAESRGFDFAQAIKSDKNYSFIPILMLTAVNVEHPDFGFSPESDGEYLPVDAFLDKPVRSEELIGKVKELLQQKTSKWQNWPEAGG
ncbi:MAG: response regulator transcription factor [Bacteroidales bacterium]|nr:response regulator transcription factor [Bacteroidales bacterium]